MAEGDYPFASTYITSAVGPGLYPLPPWPMQVACEGLNADLGVAITGDPSQVSFADSRNLVINIFYAKYIFSTSLSSFYVILFVIVLYNVLFFSCEKSVCISLNRSFLMLFSFLSLFISFSS